MYYNCHDCIILQILEKQMSGQGNSNLELEVSWSGQHATCNMHFLVAMTSEPVLIPKPCVQMYMYT
jgi:hypothetical protein